MLTADVIFICFRYGTKYQYQYLLSLIQIIGISGSTTKISPTVSFVLFLGNKCRN